MDLHVRGRTGTERSGWAWRRAALEPVQVTVQSLHENAEVEHTTKQLSQQGQPWQSEPRHDEEQDDEEQEVQYVDQAAELDA